MRSRSASAAATRRRAIHGRAARETRARNRTLSSRPGPPLAPLAPFVAAAPLATDPPREPLPLTLTFACPEKPSERTDPARSTRLASRRSTRTSSEPWPEPLTVLVNHCSSRLQRTLPPTSRRLVNVAHYRPGRIPAARRRAESGCCFEAEGAAPTSRWRTTPSRRGCRISPAPRPSFRTRHKMGRSKAFGKGSATNQSPGNGPVWAAADICDSLRRKQRLKRIVRDCWF